MKTAWKQAVFCVGSFGKIGERGKIRRLLGGGSSYVVTQKGKKVSKGEVPSIKEAHIEYSGDLSRAHELSHIEQILKDRSSWENLSKAEIDACIQAAKEARGEGTLPEKFNSLLNELIYSEETGKRRR